MPAEHFFVGFSVSRAGAASAWMLTAAWSCMECHSERVLCMRLLLQERRGALWAESCSLYFIELLQKLRALG